ncbi:MAG: hypothetical protein H7329_19580 [Opitutaceae bacterium]|nr:hypothetical protein [Cytophagales bacterium]
MSVSTTNFTFPMYMIGHLKCLQNAFTSAPQKAATDGDILVQLITEIATSNFPHINIQV